VIAAFFLSSLAPTVPPRLSIPPLDLVLPDAIARHVRSCVGVLEHNAAESVEIVAVQLRVVERLSLLLDEGIEVDILLEVDEVLAVLRVEGEKLSATVRTISLSTVSTTVRRKPASRSGIGSMTHRSSRSSSAVTPSGA